jgi:hypothetical protein
MGHFSQVVCFSGPVRHGKRKQLSVSAPVRDCRNAFVNKDSTRLSRMVRTQFSYKVM